MKDIQIDSSSNLIEINMKLTHLPTGTFVSGTGYSEYRLKNKLLEELEKKIK